jgi:hypothetical protein
MKRFSVGQKWLNKDAMYGRFFAEVTETSDQGRRGTVVITDGRGNVLDTYNDSASTFLAAGKWQLVEA